MSDKDTAERVARLEAWVDVVMQTLASLGLETLLIELDEARGRGLQGVSPCVFDLGFDFCLELDFGGGV
jgi:hypothetical protein